MTPPARRWQRHPPRPAWRATPSRNRTGPGHQEPTLWSLERPYLYRAVSRLACGGQPCDDYSTEFGVRTFAFESEPRVHPQRHAPEDTGCCACTTTWERSAAAVNTRAMERQLQIMKEMGVNAIRTSHNPPAPELPRAHRPQWASSCWTRPSTCGRRRRPSTTNTWTGTQWHVRDLSDMVPARPQSSQRFHLEYRERGHGAVDQRRHDCDSDCARSWPGSCDASTHTAHYVSEQQRQSANPMFHAGAPRPARPQLPPRRPGRIFRRSSRGRSSSSPRRCRRSTAAASTSSLRQRRPPRKRT